MFIDPNPYSRSNYYPNLGKYLKIKTNFKKKDLPGMVAHIILYAFDWRLKIIGHKTQQFPNFHKS
jgi:hypothetical protein